MLPVSNLTRQDKRAIGLYFAIALLSAAGLAFGMLVTSDFYFGKRFDHSPTESARPASRPSQ